MDRERLQTALADIENERNPSLKSLKLAGLCSALFRERGIELVVVGGSAIEFYTEGAYVSGDVDLCVLWTTKPAALRLRQEIMGELGAQGGPRSWQVAGIFNNPILNLLREFFIDQLDLPYTAMAWTSTVPAQSITPHGGRSSRVRRELVFPLRSTVQD